MHNNAVPIGLYLLHFSEELALEIKKHLILLKHFLLLTVPGIKTTTLFALINPQQLPGLRRPLAPRPVLQQFIDLGLDFDVAALLEAADVL